MPTVQRPLWGLAHVVNGTNLDDLGDYRPGLEAAKHAGVRSPLVEAGFSKDDVRRVAARHRPRGLGQARRRVPLEPHPLRHARHARAPRADRRRSRPSCTRSASARSACAGTPSRAARRPEAMARIEVATGRARRAPSSSATRSSRAGKRYGFAYVTLDLQGYRTGSHNEVLGIAAVAGAGVERSVDRHARLQRVAGRAATDTLAFLRVWAYLEAHHARQAPLESPMSGARPDLTELDSGWDDDEDDEAPEPAARAAPDPALEALDAGWDVEEQAAAAADVAAGLDAEARREAAEARAAQRKEKLRAKKREAREKRKAHAESIRQNQKQKKPRRRSQTPPQPERRAEPRRVERSDGPGPAPSASPRSSASAAARRTPPSRVPVVAMAVLAVLAALALAWWRFGATR